MRHLPLLVLLSIFTPGCLGAWGFNRVVVPVQEVATSRVTDPRAGVFSPFGVRDRDATRSVAGRRYQVTVPSRRFRSIGVGPLFLPLLPLFGAASDRHATALRVELLFDARAVSFEPPPVATREGRAPLAPTLVSVSIEGHLARATLVYPCRPFRRFTLEGGVVVVEGQRAELAPMAFEVDEQLAWVTVWR